MILILSVMLLLTLIGSLIVKDRPKQQTIENTDKIDTQTSQQLPDDEDMPESFLGTFDDEFGVKEEVKQLIINYMNDYYKSIYQLEKVDTTGYFSKELSGAISDNAIKLLVETRKLQDCDLTLKRAHYDLKITDYREDNDTYYVDLLEDDYLRFAFLDNIDSIVYDIENYFVIKNVDGVYKIEDLEKVQGYYNCFYDECESIDEVDKMYAYMFKQLKDMNSYNNDVLKVKASNNPYVSSKTHNKEYNREDAVAYLEQYYHSRNPEWFNYSETGGNCQNYASQALLAGGIPMDYFGEQQWKCYSNEGYEPEINEEETPYGRTKSWVNVGYFYDYCQNNEGSGLVADVGVNIHYGQIGDIIIVGNGNLAHTMMISKVVDGHILVDSNSIDMKDMPIEAFTYPNVLLIKILGYNQYQ